MDDLQFRYRSVVNNFEYSRRLEDEKDKLIHDLYAELEYTKEQLSHKKPYEDNPNWTTEEVADYFRCKSNAFIVRLIHERKLPVIKKSLDSTSSRPVYLFPRELVYKLKDDMTINKAMNE